MKNAKPDSSFSSKRLSSLLLPITTPFDQTQQVDAEALRKNLQKWSATGITGFVLLGSTGERVHLDEYEYLKLIEAARAEVSSDLRFWVGAGQQSTLGTISEIKRAAQVGAEAVLVITPSYYRSAITQEALIKYYNAVADAAPVPVILYSMPALTGIKIEPATIARLSDHPNIIGVKDSSADIDGLKETVRQVDEEFAVLTGNGTVLCDALLAGATGAILAVGCVVPALCMAVLDALRTGDNERATKLQSSLTPLAAAVTVRFGIGGLKAALEMIGYSGGVVRAPLRMPDADARSEIQQCLDDAQNALQHYSVSTPLSA